MVMNEELGSLHDSSLGGLKSHEVDGDWMSELTGQWGTATRGKELAWGGPSLQQISQGGEERKTDL